AASAARNRRGPSWMRLVPVPWPIPRPVAPLREPCSSEIALALLLLHRARFIVIDEPALSLGGGRGAHLGDDVGERVGIRANGAGQRIAAERPEAHALQTRRLAGFQRQAVVIDHDQRA